MKNIQVGDKIFVVGDTHPIKYQPDGITGIVTSISERGFLGISMVWVADKNGYTGTGLPRRAVCLVPEGHVGQPCRACGLPSRKREI